MILFSHSIGTRHNEVLQLTEEEAQEKIRTLDSSAPLRHNDIYSLTWEDGRSVSYVAKSGPGAWLYWEKTSVAIVRAILPEGQPGAVLTRTELLKECKICTAPLPNGTDNVWCDACLIGL